MSSTTSMPKRRSRLAPLDASRFVAAIMVVLFHWCGNGIRNGKVDSLAPFAIERFTKYGYLGVTLFFLISGFVIVFSAHGKTAGDFLAARARRLFPLFWIALLTTTLVATVLQQPTFIVTLPQVLINATMVPTLFGVEFVDGAYWTLEYEWIFYFLVFLVLCFSKVERLEAILAVWMVGIIVVQALGGPLATQHVFMHHCLAFIAGAFAGSAMRGSWTRVRLVLYACAGAAVVVTGFREASDRIPGLYAPYIAAGILALGIVFIFLNTFPWFGSIQIPGAERMGKLTYPMYLLHAHIGYMLLNEFGTESNKYWLVLVMIVGLVAVAWLCQWLGEEQLRRVWKQLFETTIRRPIDALLRQGS